MKLPVKVGDTIADENTGLPRTVTRVHVIEPMTEEQRDTAKWLGYTLGRYEEPVIYIEYKIFGHTGSIKVHAEPDKQGRLVTMTDPDSWAGGRYFVTRCTVPSYIQPDLFQAMEGASV